MRRGFGVRFAGAAAFLALLPGFTPAGAQDRPRLEIEREDGSSRMVTVQFDRGYASVAASTLEDLGWGVDEEDGALSLTREGGHTRRPDSSGDDHEFSIDGSLIGQHALYFTLRR